MSTLSGVVVVIAVWTLAGFLTALVWGIFCGRR